jgi:integrase
VSVYKRPNGRWAAQVYDPSTGRMTQLGTFGTRQDARAAEVDALRSRTAGGSEPIKSFAARWTTDYPRPKPSTNLHNAERIKRFAKEHGNRRIDSFTVDEARRWALEHPYTLPSLRAMFNDARRSGLIVVNPFSALGLDRSKGRRELRSEWLTEKDIDKLAEAARGTFEDDYGLIFAPMIVFAAYTGLRPGELFALRFSDLRGDTIEVARAADSRTRTVGLPKNGRGRTVVYPSKAREAIETMPVLEGQELVFVSPRGVQFWNNTLSWCWRGVKNAAGRPRMDWYELRHFCATHLLELGLSPADVAVQLGHTDGGALVMSTYGHPSERAARARILAAMDGHETGDLAPLRDRRAG